MSTCRSLLILAGGFGTRVQTLHQGLPKVLFPVSGRPFLAYQLAFWKRQGATDIVVSTGHLSHVIEDYRQRNPEFRVIAETAPLGTGGAIRGAFHLPDLSDPLAIINGDSLLMGDFRGLWDLAPHEDGRIVALHTADASRYGTIATDDAGYLTSFLEKRPGAGWINAGIYCFRRAAIERLRPGASSWETDALPFFLQSGLRIRVEKVHADFIDIGTPDSYARSDQFVRLHESRFTI